MRTVRAGALVSRGIGARAQLLLFVRLDVGDSIDDTAAELEEPRAFPRPTPAVEGPPADVPALGEFTRAEVADRHRLSFSVLTGAKDEQTASPCRRDRWGIAGG